MTFRLHPRDAGMVQHTKICNVMYHINKLKEENHMIISLDTEKQKTFNKNPAFLHDEGLGKNRNTGNISKHNKGNIQQVNSQHQTKWRETQRDPTEIRNKATLSILSIAIQYSIQSSS